MRVLLLFWGGGEGGDAAVVAELAGALKRKGHGPTVAAYAEAYPEVFRSKAEAAGLVMQEDLFFVSDPGDIWAQTGLKPNEFDLIHVHHGRAVPKRTDIVPLRKAAGKLPLILTAHGALPLSNITYGGIKSKISRFISPLWFDAIVVPSEAKLREWKKMTPLSRNVLAIPNIVRFLDRTDKASARRSFDLDESADVVLFCSRLEDEKDPFTFIRAIKEASERRPGIVGLIAGSGALASQCSDLIGEISAPVRLLGYVEDVSRLYSAADVFVQPSIFESFCITLLHAAAMEIPCVISDLEVFRDYYNTFDSIRWFKPGDAGACAKEIGLQVENPTDASRQRSLRTRFSDDSVIEAHEALWARVARISPTTKRTDH